nr:hypothetical protein [Streptomyces olivoreticuli]
MTALDSLSAPPLHPLTEENLTSVSPSLLSTVIKTFEDTLMRAEADALCSAEYGQASQTRGNRRNATAHPSRTPRWLYQCRWPACSGLV